MTWISCAIGSCAVYAAVNHLDAHIISRHVKGPAAMPLYTAIVVLVISFVAFLAAGLPDMGREGGLLTAAGFVMMMANIFYFRAIAVGDPAIVAAMFQVKAVFTLVLSRLFLDERLSAERLVGFVLILGAAIVLSLESVEGRFRLGKAFWPILVADFCWATAAIFVKHASTNVTFLSIVAYEGFGLALGGVAIALSGPVRHAFRTSYRDSGRGVIALVFASEGLGFLGKALFLLGVSLGPVTIVSALGGVQPFFSIAYGYLFAFLLPQLFPRPPGGVHVLKRLALAVVLMGGVWLCR